MDLLYRASKQEKSYFSEIVLQNVPWKLLELSRNKRKFNIITNYTNHIFNYFPYKIIFFLFRCYGNQASLKFVKKSWTNLMDTTFETLYYRSISLFGQNWLSSFRDVEFLRSLFLMILDIFTVMYLYANMAPKR
jgi:hypothetical protein